MINYGHNYSHNHTSIPDVGYGSEFKWNSRGNKQAYQWQLVIMSFPTCGNTYNTKG